ncbi:MAG: hypothetical protein AAF763_01210 [Pseudomonadota bacterium]
MSDAQRATGSTFEPESSTTSDERRVGADAPPAPGASAAPLAVGLGCALLATVFGWAAGWSLIAIAGGYVAGGMSGVLAGGLGVMLRSRGG